MAHKQLRTWLIVLGLFTTVLMPLSQSAPISSNQWRDNTLTPIWMPAVPLRDDHDSTNDSSFISIQTQELDDFGILNESSPVTRQTAGRVVKKDSFKPRNWGAEGMPFSILYLDTHVVRPNKSDSAKQSTTSKRVLDNSTSAPVMKNSNNRLVTRPGTGLSLRQYSVIPHLLISYGWNPFGKGTQV